MDDQREAVINKLETALIVRLAEDCANMPGNKNGEREKGFFTCAGSMFAILEHHGLTKTSNQEFIKSLDESVGLFSDFRNLPKGES